MSRARRIRSLADELRRLRPELGDVDGLIRSGRVLVNGIAVTNPRAGVATGSSIRVDDDRPLRGRVKLASALDRFGVSVAGATALDAGAAAGGFVQELLERGAGRVYAVEVGFGQLLGSLRQDPRVVNLERTNIGDLNRSLVPEAVDLVTLDLSYVPLRVAVPQLNALELASEAHLVALVKPMFELGLSELPTEPAQLRQALALAVDGIAAAGWTVTDSTESSVRGRRGADELFVVARRA